MQFLRQKLDHFGRPFLRGGKLQRLYPLFEAADSFLYAPRSTTQGRTHVRDGVDLKRIMITVVVALVPATLMAVYNTGYQIHATIESGGMALDTWQTVVFRWLGFEPVTRSFIACFIHGALYFLPITIVTYATGGLIEVGAAIWRNHEVNEGFLVTGLLIPLTLPATIPLWQVALGTAFGVILGKEIFGGTGMNFLNPALTTRAFIFFAYPAYISGDVWTAAIPPDGHSGASWLASLAEGSGPLMNKTWNDAFLGLIPGSMGETSTLAVLLGAGVLLITRVGSWRTMVGVIAGSAVTILSLNAMGSETNPMLNVPIWWHMVLGGWCFGMVFMATDPVSSAFTETGRLVYGFMIGMIAILIRCLNPAYPEGMMLSILFMNMFAPFIDHYVVNANRKRREARYALT